MKKNYSKPSTKVSEITLVNMIAESMGIGDGTKKPGDSLAPGFRGMPGFPDFGDPFAGMGNPFED